MGRRLERNRHLAPLGAGCRQPASRTARHRGAARDRPPRSGPLTCTTPSRTTKAGSTMVDREPVTDILRRQHIELPSWAFGNSGTRFKVFAQPGVPRTPSEKIDDAAMVHRLTGVAPSVALHIPWDLVDDFATLAAYAKEQGIAIGAINPNVFQDDDYKLGS